MTFTVFCGSLAGSRTVTVASFEGVSDAADADADGVDEGVVLGAALGTAAVVVAVADGVGVASGAGLPFSQASKKSALHNARATRRVFIGPEVTSNLRCSGNPMRKTVRLFAAR